VMLIPPVESKSPSFAHPDSRAAEAENMIIVARNDTGTVLGLVLNRHS
jgi:hypothetical protein